MQWPNATISRLHARLAVMFISDCVWISWKCFKHVEVRTIANSTEHLTSIENIFSSFTCSRVSAKESAKVFLSIQMANCVCFDMWPRWKTTFSFSSSSPRSSNVVCIVRKSLDSRFPLRHKRKNQKSNSEKNEREKQENVKLVNRRVF